jgi:hypothetical protein
LIIKSKKTTVLNHNSYKYSRIYFGRQDRLWTKSAVFKNEELLFNFLLSDRLKIPDSIGYKDALGIDLIANFQDASFNNLQHNDIGLISNNNLYKKWRN